jgi:hypothetical protein
MRLRAFTIAAAAVAIGVGSRLSVDARPAEGAVPAPVAALAIAATPAPAPSEPAPSVETRVAAKVDDALAALGDDVREKSYPDALRLAFQAYYSYRTVHPTEVRKPYLYFVDYGLDSRTPRGYVFDMDVLSVVDGPFTVAHGRGSRSDSEGIPTRFSNRDGSNATSLGLFLAEGIYSFTGHTGGRAYHSLGLRLRGLSGRFNSAARKRGVVVHGAPYVTSSKAGQSEGCPAMEQSRAQKLIPELENGALVYLFSPRDSAWLRQEPWAHVLALGD